MTNHGDPPARARRGRCCWPQEYLAAFAASLSEVTIGFVYGWPSAALPVLEAEAWPWRITGDESSWIVSLVDIGSMVIAIPAGLAANRLGRRRVLLSSAVFFLASWAIIIVAQSAEWLYAARLLAGMGGGTVFTVNTMYWGEIASPGFRGSASSLTQAMLFLGVLLADVVGYLYPTEYTTLAYCGLAVTLLFVACFFPMPESPHYLLMRARPDLARRALQRLRGRADVSAELAPMEEALAGELGALGGGDLHCGCAGMVRTSGARRALLIAVVVGALQRLSGFSAVIAYTSTTLPRSLQSLGPVIIGGVLVVASLAPLVLMDRLGRRPLLILSSLVVFPAGVKGLAVSGVNISLTLFTFFVSKIYNYAGEIVMYFSFAAAGVLTALFTYFVIPETRSKTLEQVVAELDERTAAHPARRRSAEHLP
ncbi:Facilitated trehalose transporter Tret1 [Frankliniella fusca]|uniref:Facilitated trehalose transporter Tret1 n=1 Tax=Frankliniella fusca TaxID=407009 RepID=A0AAE1I0A1_9NEOP|nr:Facilitated trehalose transporter Tret1 [Frankliniella fusca]